MSSVKIALAALLLGLTGLWFMADSLYSTPFDYRAFRDAAIQLSGILALGAMCAATLLAARPVWLEPAFGGLDKMYRLHKWLGIAALVASVGHWWFATGSRLFSSGGEGPHGPRGGGEQTLSLIDSLRGLSHPVGEWGFYLVVALVLIALLTRIPYRWFAYSHIVITPVFLALVFHGVLLATPAYWSQPVGWALALLCIAGVAAAAVVLARRFGILRGAGGTVEAQTWYPELRVLETVIVLDEHWTGHQPGQFAFVTTSRLEGAHPFSIASDWDPASRRIVFIAKELGDYTARLRDEFLPGRRVAVEGPYGRFDFEDDRPTQIWVGAGVGITPFIGRMQRIAGQGQAQAIHLFHTTEEVSEAALDKMRADAAAAGVALHLTLSKRDPLLDGERIRATVPDWPSASLWFCGPAGFGATLRKDFLAHGFSPTHFHQERFSMR
ncbi:MAG: ferric reductase-like transmembrane domain-containing protein [Rhodobacteraceae bacterium]|nr:ferric reductase-like transmembrane domain-containing protein [Paracoccaceae bacterium]